MVVCVPGVNIGDTEDGDFICYLDFGFALYLDTLEPREISKNPGTDGARDSGHVTSAFLLCTITEYLHACLPHHWLVI